MSGKVRQLVVHKQVEVQDFREIYLSYLEESIEYTSNEWKQNRKMIRCNRLDLESLGSWPTIYAQKLPGHWCILYWNLKYSSTDFAIRMLVGHRSNDNYNDEVLKYP